ncbi:hypothetical protein [Hydrogenimonas sp.]
MDEKLTTGRLLRIWWAWQWRSVVATFVGAMVLIAIFAFFAGFFGMPMERITLIGNLIYAGVGIFASVYFLGFALKKEYGDFRVEIVEEGQKENEEGLGYTQPLPQTQDRRD